MYRTVLKSQPDRALVTLAAEGSEPAFEAIVLRYRRPLLGYCRRLALSENRSEDVVQQTFINAWGSLRRGTEVQELRPWLYRITHNQAVTLMRASGSDDASLSQLLGDSGGCSGTEARDATDSAEVIYERQSRLRETLSAVAELPELQREALLATAVDGLSYDQVAAVLDTTGDAVRGLVYRARNSLRAGIAVVSPSPVVLWAAERAGPGVSPAAVSQWMTEAAAGGGSIGISAAAIKGAALVASSAAVVGGTVSAGLQPPPAARIPHPPASRGAGGVAANRSRTGARVDSGAGSLRAGATPGTSAGTVIGAGAGQTRSGESRSGTRTGSSPSGRPARTVRSGGGVLGSGGTGDPGTGAGRSGADAPGGGGAGGALSGTGAAGSGASVSGSSMALTQPSSGPPSFTRMRPSGQPASQAGGPAPSSAGSGADGGASGAAGETGTTSSTSTTTSTTSTTTPTSTASTSTETTSTSTTPSS